MNNAMQRCMDWMMSLGLIGMLLGVLLLAAMLVLVVMLIGRTWSRSRG